MSNMPGALNHDHGRFGGAKRLHVRGRLLRRGPHQVRGVHVRHIQIVHRPRLVHVLPGKYQHVVRRRHQLGSMPVRTGLLYERQPADLQPYVARALMQPDTRHQGYSRRWPHRCACPRPHATPACPIGTYSNQLAASECTSCPANTVTLSPASPSLQSCVCVAGYAGPGGGPCTGAFQACTAPYGLMPG